MIFFLFSSLASKNEIIYGTINLGYLEYLGRVEQNYCFVVNAKIIFFINKTIAFVYW